MSEEQGRILVVDDNRMNRIKLSRSLEQQGHAVGLAEGGNKLWTCYGPSTSMSCCLIS